MGYQRPASYREPDLLAPTGAPPPWRHKAACLGEDPELFFPVGSTGAALERIEAAKAVCQRCAVSTHCLEYALETNQDAGVWGGLQEDERRTLRRRRQRRRPTANTP